MDKSINRLKSIANNGYELIHIEIFYKHQPARRMDYLLLAAFSKVLRLVIERAYPFF